MRRWLAFVLLPISFSATYALDPGTAKGIMHVGTETITLTHAYAQLHDNAEGLLDRPREMRILIVDRKVQQEALNGLVFLPVRAMAREDKVRGLLLTFAPHDRTNVVVTFLYPPGSPRRVAAHAVARAQRGGHEATAHREPACGRRDRG